MTYLEQIKREHDRAVRDCRRLNAIVGNLRAFIDDGNGDDRHALAEDFRRYTRMLDRADRLRRVLAKELNARQPVRDQVTGIEHPRGEHPERYQARRHEAMASHPAGRG